MLKQYTVNVHLDGHYTIEDPHCPSYWRGSGCYDIEVPTWCDLEVEVWAESEVQAKKLAEEYDGYVDEWDGVQIEVVTVDSVKFVKVLEGRDEEEIGIIEDFTINWRENEPDKM